MKNKIVFSFFFCVLILFLINLYNEISKTRMYDLNGILVISRVLFSPFKNELYKIPFSFSEEFKNWLNLQKINIFEIFIFDIPIIYHPFVYVLFYPLFFIPYNLLMFIFAFFNFFLLFKIFKKYDFTLTFISLSLIYLPLTDVFRRGTLDLILVFIVTLLMSSKDERLKGFLITLGLTLKPQFVFLLPLYYLIKKRFKILIFSFLFYIIFSIFPILIFGVDLLIIYFKNLLFYSKNIILSCVNISLQSFLARFLKIAPFKSSGELYLLPERFIIFIRILSLIFLIINIYAWLKQKDEFKNVILGVFTGLLISPLFWRNYLVISIPLFSLFNKEDIIFKFIFLSGFLLTTIPSRPFFSEDMKLFYLFILFTGMILIYLSIFYAVFKDKE